MKPALKGLRVLVTRPAAQATPLCEALAELGARVTQLPLFEIEPLDSAEALCAQLAVERSADWWIFTSANAVAAARGLDAADWPAHVAAIGPATQAQLAALGVKALAPSGETSSQGLLAEPELQTLDGQTVVIITGERGLGELAPELEARGARVRSLPVYRRVPVPHRPEAVRAAVADSEVIVLGSGEALDALLALTLDRETLLDRQLLVPSQRVAEIARSAGFRLAPWIPTRVSDADYVDCLRTHVQPGPLPAMTVPESPVPTPSLAASNRPPATGSSALGRLLVLVLIVALGAGAWLAYRYWQGQQRQWQELVRDFNQLEVQTARLDSRQTDLAQAARRNAQELAGIERRIEEYDQSLGQLSEQLSGGRTRFQLSAVEQLLLLANDRVQLMADASSALLALELADQRLAALGDPRLFRVREAIARERAALQALPEADLPAAALALAGLTERAPGWPLRARVPKKFEIPTETPQAPAPPVVEAGWAARARATLGEVMGSVFILRRNEGNSPVRLLSAEQESLVHQILQLRLEAARLAFLRRDEASFRAATASASAWLRDYYNGADPGVRAAQAELERLSRLSLAPELPDISRSLTLLRAQLEPAPR